MVFEIIIQVHVVMLSKRGEMCFCSAALDLAVITFAEEKKKNGWGRVKRSVLRWFSFYFDRLFWRVVRFNVRGSVKEVKWYLTTQNVSTRVKKFRATQHCLLRAPQGHNCDTSERRD